MVLIVSVRVVETYGNTKWWNSLWLRLLEWMGATCVPFYERYEGRENVYHTCRHSCKTVSYHINAAKYSPGSMLYDVMVEKVGGYNHYWVN